jgi:hypothetical protein
MNEPLLNNPALILDEEDEETLAAIDEGIRDADDGRTVPGHVGQADAPVDYHLVRSSQTGPRRSSGTICASETATR